MFKSTTGTYQSSRHLAIYLRMIHDGGVERVMINLCQGFLQKGCTVDLVLNDVAGSDSLLNQFPQEVRIVDLQSPQLSKSLPKVMKYLKQERPSSLLSAVHYAPEIAIVAKHLSQVRTRIVVAEHSSIAKDAAGARRNELKRFAPLAARLMYPFSDAIVAVSHGVAEDLKEASGISLDRTQVIYNPIITPLMFQKSKELVKHPWFAPGELPVILAVGRLEPQKNFPNLIRAFAKVCQVVPARLMILGKGGEHEALSRLVHELGLSSKVSMPGYVSNPYAYLARAKLLALSSDWEGLPTVLIEAMALGIPIVSTNCRSGPAEILDNGKYGHLVPVNDSELLAAAILETLNGSQRFIDPEWLNQFAAESIIDQYLTVLGVQS